MRTSPWRSSVAPSPAVLRFLKIQAESVHFFSASSQATTCPNSTFCRPHASIHASARPVSSPGPVTPDHAPGLRVKPAARTCAVRRSSLVSRCLSTGLPTPSVSGLRNVSGIAQTSRGISSSAQNKDRPFWRRWQAAKEKPTRPLQPDDLPPLPGFLDDGPNLGIVLKATNELKLRCTEFDENGNVVLVNGEFKKSELIQKYGLLPRDLRKIDSAMLPHILVRPGTILINLLHLRCLIKHDRVLVFDAYGSTDSYTQSVFMYDLEGKLRQREARSAGGLPYEFRALEAVLISVTAALEGEFEGVRDPVVKVLRELEEDIDRDQLRHLLIYSKKLGTFEQKARLVRDAIDDLLEADDDLADMYLTEQAQGKERAEDDHTEVEMLLESYHKVCDEIVQVSGNLVSNIRNTEEIVKAILDANRNSLMLLDLKFSIGTLGIGAGTFIAALYGMNLKNFIEESDFGFPLVSGSCAVFTAIAIVYGLRKLRTIQRLSMWGKGSRKGVRGRGSWREVDPQAQMAGETRVKRMQRLKEEEQRRLKMPGGNGETSSTHDVPPPGGALVKT